LTQTRPGTNGRSHQLNRDRGTLFGVRGTAQNTFNVPGANGKTRVLWRFRLNGIGTLQPAID
jgi:hypothetical protein